MRGDIAHRGRTLRYVKKYRVVNGLNHERKLMAVTDAYVARELKAMTGVEPWAQQPQSSNELPKVLVIEGFGATEA